MVGRGDVIFNKLLEFDDRSVGAVGQVKAALMQALGHGDDEQAFNKELTGFSNRGISLSRMPGEGPMSDGDRILLQGGVPKWSDSNEVWANYLAAYKKNHI